MGRTRSQSGSQCRVIIFMEDINKQIIIFFQYLMFLRIHKRSLWGYKNSIKVGDKQVDVAESKMYFHYFKSKISTACSRR